MIRACIVGVTGYTGFEILQILLKHPEIEVTWLTAKRVSEPTSVAKLFPQLKSVSGLMCQPRIDPEAISKACDVVFLALPHKVSMQYAGEFLKTGIKIIDLSMDFRLSDPHVFKHWYQTEHANPELLKQAVYGLPEWNKSKIAKASLVANPGCYPTSVLLGMLPLLHSKKVNLQNPIIVDAKSGVSGAGRNPSPALHFPECNESIKAYKVLKHQHSAEIENMMHNVCGEKIECYFVPHLIPISRGILSTLYLPLKDQTSDVSIIDLYKEFYHDAPFVRVCDEGEFPEVRFVAHTNFCDIGIAVQNKIAVVVSVIDNLQKGAAGQAVQNMNIMFGLSETEGLIV